MSREDNRNGEGTMANDVRIVAAGGGEERKGGCGVGMVGSGGGMVMWTGEDVTEQRERERRMDVDGRITEGCKKLS